MLFIHYDELYMKKNQYNELLSTSYANSQAKHSARPRPARGAQSSALPVFRVSAQSSAV